MYKLTKLNHGLGHHDMRGLKKILDAGETKHFIAYVKKSYTDNGKGHFKPPGPLFNHNPR
jgi:hypothetical protein